MGIRIHKDIGFFITKEDASLIFIEGYEEVLSELYDDQEKMDSFWNSLTEIAKERLSEDDYYMAKYTLLDMQKRAKEKAYSDKLQVYKVIQSIYFNDDFTGLLFCTASQARSSRYDDLIDSYEAKTNYENKIDYLNCPIYPNCGYLYHGGLEDMEGFHEDELYAGKVYVEHLSRYAFMINKHFYDSKLHLERDFTRLLTEKGFFSPHIDESMFVLALGAGILRKEVSQKRFNSLVKPAILTHWG